MSDEWQSLGRDAAHNDIEHGGEPCSTIDEARRRCGAWLRSQPALGVTDANVEECAAAYLRAWQAHARDNAPPLDIDGIEARATAASEGPWHTEDADDGPGAVFGPSREFVAETYTGEGSGGIVAEAITGGPQQSANARFIAHAREDVPALVARVRALEARDASRRERHAATSKVLDEVSVAFDDLVAHVWRAAGETHEPPADVGALLARADVTRRESHRERSEALLTMTQRALAAEQLLDATEGTEREEELARQIRAEADARVAAARREGAEAMREACATRARDHAVALKAEAADAGRSGRPDAANSYYVAASAAGSIADAIRALRLPGGELCGPFVGATLPAPKVAP